MEVRDYFDEHAVPVDVDVEGLHVKVDDIYHALLVACRVISFLPLVILENYHLAFLKRIVVV